MNEMSEWMKFIDELDGWKLMDKMKGSNEWMKLMDEMNWWNEIDEMNG